ncbi:MAG: hypothetical protein RMJ18_02910 [Candidatus Aenigmarchaeota archaeon]|nr:hypothetical protein [Candidatus Aenigmarchaeota archaeon]MCX8191121.1 hypothetical protein [Candidatus Aenigmarchaeota archaeon]MDW8160341.1 hypothetical protein [Candidatus Aenigmarchaeota archaeon]
MGLFDVFKRKEKLEEVQAREVPTLPPPVENIPPPPPVMKEEPKDRGEVEKIDLVIDKINNLKLDYEILKEKVEKIEKMVEEIYNMAKS